MNTQSPARTDHHQTGGKASGTSCTPSKTELWKLLAAALAILIAMFAAIEFFGDRKASILASAPRQQTIVQ